LPKRGLLITFEGIDGSGKTTQASRLAAALGPQRAILTKEPGGTNVGKMLRSILLDPELSLDPKAELLLFLADRAQHLQSFIRPHLESGKAVIIDRFIDATIAYQGFGLGHPLELINTIHRMILGEMAPDRTFLFDIDPQMAQERIIRRGSPKTSVENRSENFFQKVRNGYLITAKEHPGRFKVLDALLPMEELARIILSDVESLESTMSESPILGKGSSC
jgi:dTMP kinase